MSKSLKNTSTLSCSTVPFNHKFRTVQKSNELRGGTIPTKSLWQRGESDKRNPLDVSSRDNNTFLMNGGWQADTNHHKFPSTEEKFQNESLPKGKIKIQFARNVSNSAVSNPTSQRVINSVRSVQCASNSTKMTREPEIQIPYENMSFDILMRALRESHENNDTFNRSDDQKEVSTARCKKLTAPSTKNKDQGYTKSVGGIQFSADNIMDLTTNDSHIVGDGLNGIENRKTMENISKKEYQTQCEGSSRSQKNIEEELGCSKKLSAKEPIGNHISAYKFPKCRKTVGKLNKEECITSIQSPEHFKNWGSPHWIDEKLSQEAHTEQIISKSLKNNSTLSRSILPFNDQIRIVQKSNELLGGTIPTKSLWQGGKALKKNPLDVPPKENKTFLINRDWQGDTNHHKFPSILGSDKPTRSTTCIKLDDSKVNHQMQDVFQRTLGTKQTEGKFQNESLPKKNFTTQRVINSVLSAQCAPNSTKMMGEPEIQIPYENMSFDVLIRALRESDEKNDTFNRSDDQKEVKKAGVILESKSMRSKHVYSCTSCGDYHHQKCNIQCLPKKRKSSHISTRDITFKQAKQENGQIFPSDEATSNNTLETKEQQLVASMPYKVQQPSEDLLDHASPQCAFENLANKVSNNSLHERSEDTQAGLTCEKLDYTFSVGQNIEVLSMLKDPRRSQLDDPPPEETITLLPSSERPSDVVTQFSMKEIELPVPQACSNKYQILAAPQGIEDIDLNKQIRSDETNNSTSDKYSCHKFHTINQNLSTHLVESYSSLTQVPEELVQNLSITNQLESQQSYIFDFVDLSGDIMVQMCNQELESSVVTSSFPTSALEQKSASKGIKAMNSLKSSEEDTPRNVLDISDRILSENVRLFKENHSQPPSCPPSTKNYNTAKQVKPEVQLQNDISSNLFSKEILKSIIQTFKKVNISRTTQHTFENGKENEHHNFRKKHIKCYRKGDVKIYHVEVYCTKREPLTVRFDKNWSSDDIINMMSQEYENPNKKVEMITLPRPASFETDATKSECLSTGSADNLQIHEKNLRTGLNIISKDQSLLFTGSDYVLQKHDRNQIIIKIQDILLQVWEDMNSNKSPQITLRRQTYDNCIFYENM